jgi:hypothetical protein
MGRIVPITSTCHFHVNYLFIVVVGISHRCTSSSAQLPACLAVCLAVVACRRLEVSYVFDQPDSHFSCSILIGGSETRNPKFEKPDL